MPGELHLDSAIMDLLRDAELLSASTVPRSGRQKRLSAMPIVLIACLGISLAALLGYVAYSRTEQGSHAMIETQEKTRAAMNFAKEIAEPSQGQRFMPPDVPKEEEKPAEPAAKEPAVQGSQRATEIRLPPRLSPDDKRTLFMGRRLL